MGFVQVARFEQHIAEDRSRRGVSRMIKPEHLFTFDGIEIYSLLLFELITMNFELFYVVDKID